jgi:hypothetical protein
MAIASEAASFIARELSVQARKDSLSATTNN